MLTHELVHVMHGRRGCQPPAVERAVRAGAAGLRVSAEALLDASERVALACSLEWTA